MKPAVFFVTETFRSASEKARTDALQEAVDQSLAAPAPRGLHAARRAGGRGRRGT
ncbi:MAG: hypothetical protein ACLVL7_01045 [Anaerotruncus massiliensis (ex Togo et al. 2019)]